MILYLLIFLGIVIAYISNPNKNISKSTLFWIIMGLGLFVGLGDMLGGYDRYIYGELFDSSADAIREGKWLTETYIYGLYSREIGYIAFNYFMGFLTSNRYIYILVLTLITYYLIFRSFSQNLYNYLFGIIIFLGLYFFFTFTYIRQMMAAVILWNSIKYIIDKKLIKFILVVILAASFHNSALLFLPLYFVSHRIYKAQYVVIAMVGCFMLGLTPLPMGLFETYGDISGDLERAELYTIEDTSGFRIEYVLEAVVFLFIILSNYKDFKSSDRRLPVILNCALCFCGILLIFTRSINGGRLSWFFMLGIITSLSYLAQKKNFRKLRPIVVILMFGLYLRILMAWGVSLSPYKTFFTDGVRPGDFIHDRFEYNNEYDVNKFCR